MRLVYALVLSVGLIATSSAFVELPAADPMEGRNALSLRPQYCAGYGTSLSALLWIDVVKDYADVLFDRGSGRGLLRKALEVHRLDTLWEYPLLFGAYVAPDLPKGKGRDALPFLEAGAQRFPQSWQFRIIWANYVMQDRTLDSAKARDSAIAILLPLSISSARIPDYARGLALTLLNRQQRPDQAMDILVQTYRQVPDPLIRFQFQGKIADLLRRNEVRLGVADSADFLHAIAGMLDSKDPAQIEPARQILVALVRPETRSKALVDARALARDFRAYREASASGR